MPQKQILIVGGGASGLMAAICAANAGAQVTILETNDKPGRKLLASGNGKCNLTNLHQSPACYHGTDPAFLWNIVQQFPAEKTLAFFTGLGLFTTQRDGWVYPYTEQAESVLRVLLMEAAHKNIRIKTRETVSDLFRGQTGLCVRTHTWQYEADAVILACGSPASAVRGSSDTAKLLAETLSIPFVSFQPALVPLKVRGNYSARWAGVRLHAAVTLLINGKAIRREEGNVQLASYGISGIPVFQLSGQAVRAIRENGTSVELQLDCLPELSGDELAARLKLQASLHPYKTVRQLFTGLLPEQLIPVLIRADQSFEEAARTVKQVRLTISDAASGKYAQVSSGGIAASALGTDLQVRSCPGLYVCGEAIDADGACGGYNLQWAWSSGYVAGTSAAHSADSDIQSGKLS